MPNLNVTFENLLKDILQDIGGIITIVIHQKLLNQFVINKKLQDFSHFIFSPKKMFLKICNSLDS